jgi:hypothetical protein
MRFLRSIIAVALMLSAAHVSAGYAYPTAPAGFSGSTGAWRYGGAAANAAFSSGVATSSVGVSAGGSLVQVPAKMRLASNAASFIVAAARLNPAVLATGAIATFLLSYGLEYASNQWMKQGAASYSAGFVVAIWGTTIDSANTVTGCTTAGLTACVEARIAAMEAMHNGSPYNGCAGGGAPGCVVDYIPGHYTGGQLLIGTAPNHTGYYVQYWTKTGAAAWVYQGTYTGSLAYTPPGGSVAAVDADWVAPAAATSVGDDMANQARPYVNLPVDPAINPSAPPAFLPQPYRIPTGAPQPIPGTSPQGYRQPIVDIVPAPEPAFPWRVEPQPKWLDNTDPVGITSPVTPDGASPVGNIPQEVKLETCGLPTTPACKIDESPMPTESATGPAATALEAQRQAQIDAVTNVVQPTTIGWSYGIDLPAGSCTALSFPSRLGAFEINMCTNTWVLFMRDLLAWLFAIGTAVYIWRSVNGLAGGS